MKPWLKKKDEKTIELMGAKVTVKKLTFGESSEVAQSSVKYNPVTKQMEMNQAQATIHRAVKMIKDWNLTDENDEKLPVNYETFAMLDEEFASELLQKINELDDNEVTAEEKK